ncbi:hypothetical protein MTO96_052013 [Rhipicephalus appendiculatus]
MAKAKGRTRQQVSTSAQGTLGPSGVEREQGSATLTLDEKHPAMAKAKKRTSLQVSRSVQDSPGTSGVEKEQPSVTLAEGKK